MDSKEEIKKEVKLKKDGTPSKQGEGGGKPPRYKTEQGLIEKIFGKNDDGLGGFFEDCAKKEYIPTKAGLRVWLRVDRSVYNKIKKRKSIATPIKRAEEFIEIAWNQRLIDKAPAGAIFYLKNAFKEDYKDKHESDITSGGKPIQGNIIAFQKFEDDK